MNTKFQMQIKTRNWEGNSPIVTHEISLNDLSKFATLATYINKNAGKETWNWFGNSGLPTMWDGERYVLDTFELRHFMEKNFGYKVEDVNVVKEFYNRFTPHGWDGIEWIKFYKAEEITEGTF